MEYRQGPGGDKLSLLGFGCMRFSKKNGKGGKARIGLGSGGIDLDKAERELRAAIEGGVNYLDTAYIYHGSELALGEILSRTGLRYRIYLATKLPQYLVKTIGIAERLFQEQLSRLQTDYIDYYLMHMLGDVNSWEKLCRLGMEDWIAEKKASGKIRHIGFSYHGNTEMFLKLLDVYPWDFVQIQYNYMDEHSQAGRRGLEEAARRGIPVIIMEPLRGGSLTDKLPPAAEKLIRESAGTCGIPSDLTPAGLSFRWLYDQPGVTCVLSGMHSLDMVRENVRTASPDASADAEASPVTLAGSFTEAEHGLVEKVKEIIAENTLVGCTGCGYCQPCPAGVDIPLTFHCWNVSASDSLATARMEYIRGTLMQKKSSGAHRCTGCGKCVKHCPQHIHIPSQLKEAQKVLETPLYQAARAAFKMFRIG